MIKGDNPGDQVAYSQPFYQLVSVWAKDGLQLDKWGFQVKQSQINTFPLSE